MRCVYLLRDIQFGDDGDFQQQRFGDLVNNDLANTIGNLLNRTASMARKWFGDSVPPAGTAISTDHPLRQHAEAAIGQVREAMLTWLSNGLRSRFAARHPGQRMPQ